MQGDRKARRGHAAGVYQHAAWRARDTAPCDTERTALLSLALARSG